MTQFTRKVRLFSNNRMEVLEAMTYSEQLRVLRVLDLPAEWTLADGETPVAATVKKDTLPGTDHLWSIGENKRLRELAGRARYSTSHLHFCLPLSCVPSTGWLLLSHGLAIAEPRAGD